MRLNRRIRIAACTVHRGVGGGGRGDGRRIHGECPPVVLGIGQYRVTIELPSTGGLYPSSNVTYRGWRRGARRRRPYD